MAIYEKPTKELMREYAATLKPGQTFTRRDAVAWFGEHYPKTKANTVSMHVAGMAVNAPALRRHHPSIKPGSGYDLFYKVDLHHYRLWDPTVDPQPLYGNDVSEASGSQIASIDDDNEAESGDESAESQGKEFAYERDLKNYLARNLTSIEPGLRLYQEEGFSGLEFPVGGRFIDILALDATDNFVVIELKVSRGYDRVIGQLLRYMAWVKTNLAESKAVRGAIVASEISDDLKLAASLIGDVKLVEYELSFKLKTVALSQRV